MTGGGNGLGKEICIQLAKHGCNVAVADIVHKYAECTAKEISETYGVKAKGFQVDVSDFDAIQKLRDDIESSLGCVDILVNNAGIFPLISLREGSAQDVQRILNVNLSSHFWVGGFK